MYVAFSFSVPFFDLIGHFSAQLLVLSKTIVFKVVVRVAHIWHEEHELDLGSKVRLSLHIVDFVLKSHWNKRFIQASYPGVTQGLFSRVAHLMIKLGQSVEQIGGKSGEVVRELELVELEELSFVSVCAKISAIK